MTLPYEEFDLSGVATYPLASRQSKVTTREFASAYRPGSGVAGLIDSLPSVLAARELREIVGALLDARRRGAPIIWGLGAHVIKTGLGPVVADLLARGFVSAIALNGAGVIHDFEIALGGQTSEDVDAALGPGQFGMARETAEELNAAIAAGASEGLGLGQSVLRLLALRQPRFSESSLLCAAARHGVPVTVHVALGTDIIHMHPAASGEAIGAASLRDFRYFVSLVSRLAGGVFLNCGSAVILPEVFLKAVALVRNRGVALRPLTTVNLDFIRQYRAETNVVSRPTRGIGRGYSLVGHHEVLLPLIAASLVEQDGGDGVRS